jgi:hypothetical protein
MGDRTFGKSGFWRAYPIHGWLGLALASTTWLLNWSLDGLRTHVLFFPLWLGYCLVVDALVYTRKGTSLLTRSWRKYIGLFFVSAPVWWIFEVLNWRLQNWYYKGSEAFTSFEFWFWATINFTTVIPAVFGTAEFIGSFDRLRTLKRGLTIHPTRGILTGFFLAGLSMFVSMLIWPRLFFPFMWLSLYFILEPINARLGNRSLADRTARGDWRPVIGLWLGVLVTGFFWEMWNFYSFPKWIYQVPWGNCCKIFEMPLLGYGGYLPFALELFAIYHLVAAIFGEKRTQYIQIIPED